MDNLSHLHQDNNSERKDPATSRLIYWIAVCVFAVFGGYYLWAQHRAHVLQYWPLAFFLLCPLMHLFGGHGHRGHGKHHHNKNDSENGGNHHA